MKIDIFAANPYNDEDINLIKNFEKKNNVQGRFSKELEAIKKIYTKEQYNNKIQKENNIFLCLFIKNKSEINDLCIIKGEKDRKIVYITYPELNNKKRKIISSSTNYVFNVLGIEEVFVSAPKKSSLIKELEYNSFESLGILQDETIEFVKEKQIDNENERFRQWK